ncbi:protein FAM124A-like isoform X2 [Ptychodera flava]|uniref:protein FAM124A-like isoform X2 n=2 Tax=Ptychodera flava TaxID=63121 RepID=UPI003969D86B
MDSDPESEPKLDPRIPYIDWLPIDPLGSMASTSSDDSFEGELGDPFILSIHFISDPGEAAKLRDLLQPLLEWFDPEFRLFNIVERNEPNGVSHHRLTNGEISQSTPSMAILLFLQEEILIDRVSIAQQYLGKQPWKFHHSITPNGRYSLCPPNQQDYYSYSDSLPLWGVRQVHYGKEHLRFQLFCSELNWNDMIEFYRLILGKEPEEKKEDFCYFVVYSQPNLDVQLALKRVPKGTQLRTIDSAILQFKVNEVGSLVPLLPNVCSPISKRRWQTTDYDGNKVLLQLTKKGRRSGSVQSSKPRPRIKIPTPVRNFQHYHPGWYV